MTPGYPPALYASAYFPVGNSADAAGAAYAASQLHAINDLSNWASTSGPPSLESLGVPNEGGRISWPLGLRILAPEEQGGLRQQIEVLFNTPTQDGAIDASVAEELGRAVEKLRKLLLRDKERMGLPVAVHRESERFVGKLKAALKSRG